MKRYLYYSFLLLFFTFKIKAQFFCLNPGQNPSSAIPVCGTTSFIQQSVSLCAGKIVPVPPCGAGYNDKNPFWYKFHCFSTGTFGFLIIPNNSKDDYDWQLFDITGHKPTDIYTNASLFVTCNWSGVPGNTGAVPGKTSVNSCGSDPDPSKGTPNQTAMPTIYQGHDYLLLISHWDDTQYGYQINFGGGTSSIVDPLIPAIKSARAICDGTQMQVVMNKKIRCATLATDGSDFIITPSTNKVIAASSNCAGGYDMDSIQLTLSGALTPGNYQIAVVKGSDGNTLEDICYQSVAVGDSATIAIYPLAPTPFDSIKPIDTCNTTSVQLYFRRPIKCASIASNGSDFVVIGPSKVKVLSAKGVECNADGTAYTISVQFSEPIFKGGNYQIKLQQGSDGNSIIDECEFESIPDQTINFYVKQAVLANINYFSKNTCKADTVTFSNDGANGINIWTWTFDNGEIIHERNPIIIYNSFENHPVTLTVSNKECSDTKQKAVILYNDLFKANFENSSIVCPNQAAVFSNTSSGNIISYLWDFGNGNISTVKNPDMQYYPTLNVEKDYTITLVVKDTSYGIICFDTTQQIVRAVPNCFIAVPSAFTPNGDGLNDFLYPLNAYKAINLHFQVFNRFGQLVFDTKDWTKKWDGKFNNNPETAGTYVWKLEYTDSDSGKKVFQKGTVVLIR